jgi:cysteine-rich repeat protein
MSNGANNASIVDPRVGLHPTLHVPQAFFSQGAGLPEAAPGECGTVPWELYAGPSLIDSGVLSQSSCRANSARTVWGLSEGSYRLLSQGPTYSVGTAAGVTEVELSFDTTQPPDPNDPYDPDPPYMTSLEVPTNGRLTNRAVSGEAATVAVEVSDEGISQNPTGVGTVSVTYSTSSGDITVPAAHVGGERYEAEITCDEDPVDLTVIATDNAGNSMRQDFLPGLECSLCGNGALDSGEACDDDNTVSCDGCSASCQLEGSCGDTVLDVECEGCDDGNTSSCDGCSATCEVEGFCGDTFIDPTCEACDDGNIYSCDGCSGSCQVEGFCGDGTVDPVCEECDDGNTVNGDGCESDCTRSFTPLSAKKLIVRDHADAEKFSKRKIVVVSRKDPSITVPYLGWEGDPIEHGATFTVFNPSTGQSRSFDLPAEGWFQPRGPYPRGYKYLDKTLSRGPCKVAIVKPQTVLRVVCVGDQINFLLQDPSQGSLGAKLQLGTDPAFCVYLEGAAIRRDYGTGTTRTGLGLFKGVDAQTPEMTSCAMP